MKFRKIHTIAGTLVLVPCAFYSKVITVLGAQPLYETRGYYYFISKDTLFRCPKSSYLDETKCETVISQWDFNPEVHIP